MKATKKINNGILEFALEGRLDTTTAPEFEEVIGATIPDIKVVRIDASKLEYVSSAGLRILLSLYKKYGALEVVGASDTIKEVFDITGLANFFQIK